MVRSPSPFWLGRNGCWPSRGSQLPRALSFIFSLCCPQNVRRRAAHSFLKIDCLFSFSLFFCPSLTCIRLFILLLLMSGNVHPNPGPIFPCSACAENVTWREKLVQCCTCSKWTHVRCLQLFLHKFRALGSSDFWSCPPCRVSTRNTVTFSSDSSDMYTSIVQSGIPLLMLHSRPTLVFKSFILHLPTLYLLPLHPCHRPLFLTILLRLLPSLSPLTFSGFFNGMLEISEPGTLNCYTLFRLIPLTLSVSRNLILIHLPLSEFLDSLLCDLIAATQVLIFFLLMSPTLAAASSFSSGRSYPSLNFLPPLFLRLIPTLIM